MGDTQESIFVVNALHISANIVLCYDHLLTFDAEVAHFWGTPLTLGNALFFLNRYLTLIVSIVLWAARGATSASEECGPFLYFRELSLAAAQWVVMAILFLRTYALYNRSRKITFVLGSATVVQFVIGMISLFGSQQQATTQSGDPASRGCQVLLTATTAHRLSVPWMAVLGTDVLIFGLTLARTWHANDRDELARIVRRDAAFYFGIMVLANLINIIAYWAFPLAFKSSLSQFASCLSVTMASRLCLNIQRPAPPPEFTSVLPNLVELSQVGYRRDDKRGSRPLTWASDLTVSGNIGDDESYMTKQPDTENTFTRSQESVLRSPEIAEWRVYAKGMSAH